MIETTPTGVDGVVMRVSEKSIYDGGKARLEQRRSELAVATEQAATGVRVARAKDDPRAAALLVRHEGVRARADAIADSTATALDDLAAVDGALGDAGNILNEATTVAIQMNNGIYGATERQNAATQVDQLLKAFVGAVNVESDGRYLLAGTREGTVPFAADGTYNGDDGVRRMELAPGITEQVSVRGDVGISGVGGGVDIPGAFIALRTALENNDTDAIKASIDGLNKSVAQLSSFRAEVGTRMQAAQGAQSVALGVRDASVNAATREREVDITEAATNLAFAERAFEAATTATARSFKPTLLDKL